jgi:uncharacterized protein (DUF849 family)
VVRRLVACLNGSRPPGSHPALPVSPGGLAADTVAVLEAGATEVHVHPRDTAGAESADPGDVGAAVTAIKTAVPGVTVSVTTKLGPSVAAESRLGLVSGWTVLPDLASVNVHEPGSLELAQVLADLGVGVEAGLWTPEAARLFADSGLPDRCRYVLIEPMDPDVRAALQTALSIRDLLNEAAIDVPRMLHGEGAAAWGVFYAAADAGLDVRMGLEDTFDHADGARAAGNAALVRAARERLARVP